MYTQFFFACRLCKYFQSDFKIFVGINLEDLVRSYLVAIGNISLEDCTFEDGASEDGASEDCTLKDGTLEDDTLKEGTLEDDTLEDGASKDGTLDNGLFGDDAFRDDTFKVDAFFFGKGDFVSWMGRALPRIRSSILGSGKYAFGFAQLTILNILIKKNEKLIKNLPFLMYTSLDLDDKDLPVGITYLPKNRIIVYFYNLFNDIIIIKLLLFSYPYTVQHHLKLQNLLVPNLTFHNDGTLNGFAYLSKKKHPHRIKNTEFA